MRRFITLVVVMALAVVVTFPSIAITGDSRWTIAGKEMDNIWEGIDKLFPEPQRCRVKFTQAEGGTRVAVSSSRLPSSYSFIITPDGRLLSGEKRGSPEGYFENQTRQIIEGVMRWPGQKALGP